MKQVVRVLGPIVFVLGLAACGASRPEPAGVPAMQPSSPACMSGGQACRWDEQCCSGRCYVDTGCSG